MKLFATLALFSSSLALSRAVFEPTIEDVNEKAFGAVRSLLDENLPLPKEWITAAKEPAPSKTFGLFDGNHPHHDYGSYPYHGNPGGNTGGDQPAYPGKPGPCAYSGGNTRMLFVQHLPLPKDWMVAAKDGAYGGEEHGDNDHQHDHHGSYPYGGGPGGEQDGPSYGNPGGNGGNAYPGYGGGYPDKMAPVPGAAAYTPKAPAVRSLETVVLKKSEDDQKTPFYLRGRRSSAY